MEIAFIAFPVESLAFSVECVFLISQFIANFVAFVDLRILLVIILNS